MASELDAPRKIKTIEHIRQELAEFSPLALTQNLIDYEIADMQSSSEILKQVYEEFGSGAGVQKGLLEPVGLALCDGVIRSCPKVKECAKRYGLTASKMFREIDSFDYSGQATSASTQNRLDERSQNLEAKGNYKRTEVVNPRALENHLKEQLKQDGPVEDDYKSGRQPIDDKDPEKWRRRHGMDVDHVVTAKNVHELANLFAYTPTDPKACKKMVREAANTKDNLAITTAALNRSKNKQDNFSYVIENWDKLSPDTRKAMFKEGAQAQAQVAGKMAFGLSTSDLKEAGNLKDIAKKMENSGAHVALNEQLGNIVAVILGPIWYEIKDIAINGICHKMETDSYFTALAKRFKRASLYIFERIPSLFISFVKDLWTMLFDLVKSIIASFFKKALFIIKEGVGVIVQAFKILLQPAGKMSPAQKGDAILKLVGSLIPALLIEIGLSSLLIPYFSWWPPGADIAAGVISAFAAAILAYFLDKLDLFSLKSELRLARVREIFDLRIQEIRQSAANFNIAVFETLKNQRIQFEALRNDLSSALQSKNMEKLNETLDHVADFFQVDIPYSTPQEFLQYIRQNDRIIIST